MPTERNINSIAMLRNTNKYLKRAIKRSAMKLEKMRKLSSENRALRLQLGNVSGQIGSFNQFDYMPE